MPLHASDTVSSLVRRLRLPGWRPSAGGYYRGPDFRI